MANHAYVQTGATIRFITNSNTVVSRTVSTSTRVGTTDIRIGLLDSDLPSTITPAFILGHDWRDWFEDTGTPVCYTDQEEKLLVAELSAIINASVTIRQPVDATRATFYDLPVSGDSGNPIFLIVRGKPVLLTTFFGINGGHTLIGDRYYPMLAVIESLGSYGHSPKHIAFGPVRTVTLPDL